MANTALNRTGVFIGTNKSGGALNYGDVVVLDNTNNNGFTTTTTAALSTRGIGVIIEPNGIGSNLTGLVASSGWVPKVNLNGAATAGQLIATHTVAGQAAPHSSPQITGDFGFVLDVTSSSSPTAWLFGSPNGAIGGSVTNTGTLTSGKTIVGNGTVDVTVSSLTAQFVGSSSGTEAAASMTTSRLLGRTTAGSGAVEEISVGASMVFSSTTLNGRIVQIVNTETGALTTGSTLVPIDDTIPTITEGDEYMTLAITPTSATNKLHIEVVAYCSSSVQTTMVASLFQDATTAALASSAIFQTTGTGFVNHRFVHRMTAGTTSSTTFRVRIGGGNAGTLSFNGAASSRFFGGALASSITITEISV